MNFIDVSFIAASKTADTADTKNTINSTYPSRVRALHAAVAACVLVGVSATIGAPLHAIAETTSAATKDESKPSANDKASEKANEKANEKAKDSAKDKDGKVLKEVTVSSQQTYQPGPTNIGKTKQLVRDIPQSVTVVPESLIRDRGADTFREALRNVPSITFNAGEGGRIGDNITLRGFSVVGDLYLDGIRDVAQYNRDTFNNEQIEVLRGSSSMLYGRGSTGGIVNQVSKLPSVMDRTEITGTVGSFDFRRATLDTNVAFEGNAAIRVNAMQTKSNSFRDNVKTDRTGFAPAIRFGIGTANDFTLQHYHLEYKDVPDYGVPYFNGKPLNVPLNTFYGLANVDYQRDKADITTATYLHTFQNNTTWRSVLRGASYHRDLWATAPRLAAGTTVITENTVINRGRQARGGNERNLTWQNDVNTKFAAFGLQHELLIGTEFTQENAGRWNIAQATGVSNPTTTVGNPNANPTLPANYFSSIFRTGDVTYEAKTRALYAQDTLKLNAQWKVIVGARFDDFSADYVRAAPQGPLSRTDRVWSWRSGVLYQPNDNASYYASVGNSFNPSGELYALDDRGAKTPPEKSRNSEIGAKWELFDGNLSARAALFRSEKLNERNTDLAVTIEQNLLSGKRHTNGVEIEAAGRITAQWEVFAGVSRMSAKIDRATGQQAATLGKTPINTPDYTASVWTVYKLTPQWRIGGGLEAVGKRFANGTNTNEVPAYTRSDWMISYEKNAVAFRLNLLNAFDRKIYEGVYSGHVVPGTKRAAQLSATLKF
jgi:catecholate siderophore receptor